MFALTANDLVVAGPGYEYTFQLSGWGWVNILTGVVLAAMAVAVFLGATVVIWGVATWNTSRESA